MLKLICLVKELCTCVAVAVYIVMADDTWIWSYLDMGVALLDLK